MPSASWLLLPPFEEVDRSPRFLMLLCMHATAPNPDRNTADLTICGQWPAGFRYVHSAASCFYTLYGAKLPSRTANPLRPACFPVYASPMLSVQFRFR